MGKLYEENWYKKWQKEAILGKFSMVYRYRYRAIPVQPTRGQPVPVQVQPVSVQANRMLPVPVQVQGVPGTGVPKMPRMLYFVYLSSNSYTVSMGTLLND